MNPSYAARLLMTGPLLAALSACYVVPIDPRTGQPVPINGNPQVQTSYAAPPPPLPPAFTLLQARLYPLNETAQSAGLLTAQITDQHSGRGTVNLAYRGQAMQGEATRVDGSSTNFGSLYGQVLGTSARPPSGRRGIANAVGGGISAQCEYVLSGSTLGTGACLFSDGARYQMHFGQ